MTFSSSTRNRWRRLPGLPVTVAMASYLLIGQWLRAQDGVPVSRPASAGATVERVVVAMGTTLRLEVVAASRPAGLRASEAAVQAVAAVETRLSTWRPDSELSRLNATPAGEPFRASPELCSELTRCGSWARATDGAFDPAIGSLLTVYDVRGGGLWPTASELAAARADAGLQHVRLNGRSLVRERAGVQLDAGAFGKGVALDAAAKAAVGAGAERVWFDFGGQVLVAGELVARDQAGGSEQRLAVADPRQRDRPLVAIDVAAGSLATTGNGQRGRLVDGRLLGHVLDPRTGLPAADFGSVTVWASDAMTADCLSTGLFVMGAEQALAWALAHDGVEALVLEVRGDRVHAHVTPGLRQRVTALAADIQIHDS